MKTIEEQLIEMINEILTSTVNFYLSEMEEFVPLVELSSSGKLGSYGVCPQIELSEAARTDKDRIVRTDAYTMTITFVMNSQNNKRDVYCYAAALESAINDDPTFGGVADRVAFVNRKYKGMAESSGECQAVFTLRVTIGK
ncbi:hypothetical protein FACS1894190_08210 [Spirochaetia bacterium]|nr:hypothetical protein FACS1894190_08210 [Spirochaetia bacterium]